MNHVPFVCFIPNKACANQCAECEYLTGLARQRATSDTKQDTPVSGVVCGADSKLTVTFEYWPIESAPRNKIIRLFDPLLGWERGMVKRDGSVEFFECRYGAGPTHWCHAEDMRPASMAPLVVEDTEK